MFSERSSHSTFRTRIAPFEASCVGSYAQILFSEESFLSAIGPTIGYRASDDVLKETRQALVRLISVNPHLTTSVSHMRVINRCRFFSSPSS